MNCTSPYSQFLATFYKNQGDVLATCEIKENTFPNKKIILKGKIENSQK